MPPLFLYAVVFLCILITIGFVVCLREGADPQGEAGDADAIGARPTLRRAVVQPRAGGPTRETPRPPTGEVRFRAAPPPPATPDAPVLRPPAAGPDHTAPSTAAVPWTGAGPEPDPLPAGDSLAIQVMRLTQQVADLKAERQNFEEEIRRLHRVVQEATVAISDLKAAQSAKPARNTAAGTRPISIHDLRVRRLG